MLSGTRRDLFESVLGTARSASELAEQADLSVQAVYAHLKALEEDGYVMQTGTREGRTRPEKLYRAPESAYVFAAFDGELSERHVELSATHRTMFSILRVPQSEFHAPLLSYLFSAASEWPPTKLVAVYGSVARGSAEEGSDIDLLHVVPDSVALEAELSERYDALTNDSIVDPSLEYGPQRIVSREWFTEAEFDAGLNAGGHFSGNVLREAIALYNPDNLLQKYRETYGRE